MKSADVPIGRCAPDVSVSVASHARAAKAVTWTHRKFSVSITSAPRLISRLSMPFRAVPTPDLRTDCFTIEIK